METNLIVEGIKLIFLGMGAIFLFLIVTIYFMGGVSNFVHKFFPEILASTSSSSQSTQNIQCDQSIQNIKSDLADQKKIVAAITAAIQYHREG